MAKNIQGSVGQGGLNLDQNVLIVQYLLNCVPAANGGPAQELVVDGIAGPKTIAAIQKFQKANFNSADGRVDTHGNTIKALQQYDPFPQIPLVSRGQKSFSTGLKIGGKVFGNLWEKNPPVGEKMGGLPGSKGIPGYKSF